jgi:hypothetical protein
MANTRLTCTPRSLPSDLWESAARTATEVNPANRPPVNRVLGMLPPEAEGRFEIAVLTSKFWRGDGVKLTVGFMERTSTELKRRIVSHLNAWSKTANIKFVQARTDPEVRIAFEGGDDGGYWSYLGTDILQIPPDEQTMNLEAFTMRTSEAEFKRVIRHEAGHTLGFPHEHMRKELVERIDRKKAVAYFERTQGWTEQETKQQVLTPLNEANMRSTPADQNSIMCYQLPGTITKDGMPILGGKDIDQTDYEFVGRLYPKRSPR